MTEIKSLNFGNINLEITEYKETEKCHHFITIRIKTPELRSYVDITEKDINLNTCKFNQ